MLLLTCPHCGVAAEETEFHAGGEAHIIRAATADAADQAFYGYLFERKNPRGPHFERWRHIFGCGKWFHVARDTATLEVFGVYPVDMSAPPQEIIDRIAARAAAKGGR